MENRVTEQAKQAYYEQYMGRTHIWGRAGVGLGILLLLAAPLAVMCVLFVAVPALIGQVSFLILLGGGLSIALAWLMFRRGRL